LIGVTAPAVTQLTVFGKASNSAYVGAKIDPDYGAADKVPTHSENSWVFMSAN
jgi:hypothetical protein